MNKKEELIKEIKKKKLHENNSNLAELIGKEYIQANVNNLELLERLIEQQEKVQEEIDKLAESVTLTTKAVEKIPNKVTVTNPVRKVEVANFPKMLPPPKTVKVERPSWFNQSKFFSELKKLSEGIGELINYFKRNRLKINADEYKRTENALAVKIVKGGGGSGAVTNIQESSFKQSSGKGDRALVDSDGHVQVDVKSVTGGLNAYEFNNMAESGDITYIGLEEENGVWCVIKVDESDGVVITYASQSNNSGTTTYTTAWNNRASLTYNIYSIVF